MFDRYLIAANRPICKVRTMCREGIYYASGNGTFDILLDNIGSRDVVDPRMYLWDLTAADGGSCACLAIEAQDHPFFFLGPESAVQTLENHLPTDASLVRQIRLGLSPPSEEFQDRIFTYL